MTITTCVTSYIKSKPYLLSALTDGIVNLTALAEHINSEIEVLLEKPVKKGAIVMALRRISSNEEFTSTHKIIRVLKNMGDITVRSSLIDYSFSISDTLLLAQSNLLKKIEGKKEVFYTSSRGVSECNMVVSNNISDLVDRLFKKETLHSKIENLSSITIKLPTENVTIPGIYYFIFQRLSWEGVNINEVISTSNEFTILMDESQVNIAFEVIKNLKSL
ncbi:MAG: aspartate kinase [Flavobacteriaceae bacterium]